MANFNLDESTFYFLTPQQINELNDILCEEEVDIEILKNALNNAFDIDSLIENCKNSYSLIDALIMGPQQAFDYHIAQDNGQFAAEFKKIFRGVSGEGNPVGSHEVISYENYDPSRDEIDNDPYEDLEPPAAYEGYESDDMEDVNMLGINQE